MAGQVDRVGAQVAVGAAAGSVFAEAPVHRELGIDQPVLQIGKAGVANLPDGAFLDHLFGECHGRATAVVEIHRVFDAGLLHRGQHLFCFGQRERERLLAPHVLAGLGSGHGDVAMRVAGRRDVDDIDVFAADGVVPIGGRAFPTPPFGELAHRACVAAADHLHHRLGRQVEKAADGAPGLAVGLAHKLVADECNVELFAGHGRGAPESMSSVDCGSEEPPFYRAGRPSFQGRPGG
jgi:hypothetical protein